MVQFIERPKSSGQRLFEGFQSAAEQFPDLVSKLKKPGIEKAENERIKELTGKDVSGLSPEIKKLYLEKFSKGDIVEDIKKLRGSSEKSNTSQNIPEQENNEIDLSQFSPDERLVLASKHPQAMRFLQGEDKQKKKDLKEDREFHSKRSEKILQEADTARTVLRSKENSLKLLEDAIQNMPEGFSQDYLAEITGFEPFRTAKGAQFKTASKEFLLSNIARAGARPNMWIEQQVGDMAAKIGRTKEANETFVAAQKHDLAVEKKRLDILGDLEEKYMKELGYVPKNIGKISEDLLRPYADLQQEKLAYELRQIHERESGPYELNSLKKVRPGTPLTLEKAMIIYGKAPGDTEIQKEANAETMAKNLGYSIPRKEIYQGNQ